MERNEIINFSASFWQVDAEIIQDQLRLDDKQLPNNSSIRFYQFLANLESHFKTRIDDIHNVVTFGDLISRLQ